MGEENKPRGNNIIFYIVIPNLFVQLETHNKFKETLTYLRDLRFRNSLGLLAARPAQRSSRQDVLGSLCSHGALAKIRSSG